MSKGFTGVYLLIGVLILAALAGAAYLGKLPIKLSTSQPQISTTPTPQVDASPVPNGTGETDNWKTYRNTTIGFEIKYPEGYVYKLEKENADEVSFSGLFQPGDQAVPDVLVITRKVTNLDSVKACEEENTTNPCFRDKLEAQKLGNEDAITFDLQYRGGGFGFSSRIQTVKEPKIEIYRTVYGGGGINTFEKILSTFKFN